MRNIIWMVEQPWRERPDGSIATSVAVRDYLVPHLHGMHQAGTVVRVVPIAERGSDVLGAAPPGSDLIFSHTRGTQAARLMFEALAQGHHAAYLLPFDLYSGRLDGHHFLMASLADRVLTESALECSIGQALVPTNWILALPPIRHGRKSGPTAPINPSAAKILIVALSGSDKGRSRLMTALAGLDVAMRQSLWLHVLVDLSAMPDAALTSSRRFKTSAIDSSGLTTGDLHGLITSQEIALTILSDCSDVTMGKRVRRLRDQLIWLGCPAAIAGDGNAFQVSDEISIDGLGRLVQTLRDAGRFGDLFDRVQREVYARHEHHAIGAVINRHHHAPRFANIGPSWPNAAPGTRQSAPVVDQHMVLVAGAHRSGTSLVAEILSALGVHMGGDVDPEQHESAAFQQINEWLLNTGGATWDTPGRFLQSLRRPGDIATGIRMVRRLAHSSFLTQYWRGFAATTAAHMGPRLAGWKDPRNCLTWPIWRAVYPRARFVIVQRNPWAAAASLVRRHRKVLYETYPRDDERIGDHGGLCLVIDGMRVTERCFALCGALELIEEHRAALDRVLHAPDGQCHVVPYEDLVARPKAVISDLATFLAIAPSPDVLARAVRLVRAGTRSA